MNGHRGAHAAPESSAGTSRESEEETALYRVYKDLRAKRWFVEGITIEYVELHSASAFSFLEGASRPEDLVSRAKD